MGKADPTAPKGTAERRAARTEEKYMNRLKKIVLGILLFTVIFAIAGFFALPPLLKSVLTRKLSENLHREVSLETIRFNPFMLRLSVHGFSVREREGGDTFVSFEELFIDLDASSILKKAIVLEEIRLARPFFRVVLHDDGSFNFSDLLSGGKPETAPKESGPFPFAVRNLRITEGKVAFADRPRKREHTAEEIRIELPFLSSLAGDAERFVEPSIGAKINGTALVAAGRTKPFSPSRETEMNCEIGDLPLPDYLAYAPAKLNFRLLSASLNAKTSLSFRQEKEGPPHVALRGLVTVKDIAIDDPDKKPVLRLPSVRAEMASVRPLAGEIRLSKLVLEAPALNVLRDRQGRINLLTLFPETPPPPKKEEKREGAKTVVEIDEILVEKGQVAFQDTQLRDPFRLALDNIQLRVNRFSTESGREAKASLSLDLPKNGSLSLEGPMRIDPLSAQWSLALKNLDIPAFQPYLSEAVNVRITGGKISAGGNLSLDSAGGSLKTRYSGKLLVSRFASIDALQADDLLKWSSLSLNGIEAGHNPLSVRIREIALSDFYTRILIGADGILNLQKLAVEKGDETGKEEKKPTGERPASSAKDAKTAADIRMGAITLQGGEIDFTDRYIQPNFSGRFVEMGGRISGLSSMENTAADVELRGKLDGYAPLEVTGKINPLRKDLFVDLKAAFKDMDLSPLTPYSGKYIGYTIQKGKLSFDLKYLIEQKKLDSQNRVFIDQFTLGEKVESPQATKLPVSLAIALLKDRHGQIKLDIPVSGTLDDPKFSVWRIIFQVLGNLLVKAATAPFALLGSLFGGGAELGFLEFDYGSALVGDMHLKKIEPLVKSLQERPALKLEIGGYVDAAKDGEKLKDSFFLRKLQVQKLSEQIRKGEKAGPVEEVAIGAAEYERYLKAAYDAEKFPKPADAGGRAKELPVPEMEKLILTHTEVSDDDLRLLASRRAVRIRDAILRSKEITPDRVFILETKTLAPPKKENLKESRVDFNLK
jgi:hypothetical protein